MQTITTERPDKGYFVEASSALGVSYPAKALALDIVNTARRIGALEGRVLTEAARRDAIRAISTMRNLLVELDFELSQ